MILDRNYREKATKRPGQFLICFRSVGGIMNGVHLVIGILVEDSQRAVASHRVRFLIVSSSANGLSRDTNLGFVIYTLNYLGKAVFPGNRFLIGF